jgi:hypothetical protein
MTLEQALRSGFKYAVLLVVILTSSQPARAGGIEHVDLVALGSVLIEIDLPVSHSVTQSQLATPPGFKGRGNQGARAATGAPIDQPWRRPAGPR